MEPEVRPIFEQFVFALMSLMDERQREKPLIQVIDNWYSHAQALFEQAVSSAVKAELERIKLEIVVTHSNGEQPNATSIPPGVGRSREVTPDRRPGGNYVHP